MVHHNSNRNSFSMFQHYSSRENKKLQHELEKNGRTVEQSSEPLSLGKGAQDYKNPKSHHMNRKIFAIIIPCSIVVIALVVIGAFSSYHRDAPSTTTPEVSTQANSQKKPKRIKKVHKIKRNTTKKTQPKDNIVTIFQNKASSPKKNSTSNKTSSRKTQSTKSSKSNPNKSNTTVSSKQSNNTNSTPKNTSKQSSDNSQSDTKFTNQQPSHSNSSTKSNQRQK